MPDGPADDTIEDGDAASLSKDQSGHVAQNAVETDKNSLGKRPQEHGGQRGLEPTRYGDWEKNGRCTDF